MVKQLIMHKKYMHGQFNNKI